MTNREFVIWLSGFFEMQEDAQITKHQLYIISNHLNLAEAVEGALGDFNKGIREIVRSEIERMQDQSNDNYCDEDVAILLKDKVLAQIKTF
jgi:hypothetical protein